MNNKDFFSTDAVNKTEQDTISKLTKVMKKASKSNIADGTYEATTRALKFKLVNAKKVIEISYNFKNANGKLQIASDSYWLAEDFINPQSKATETSREIVLRNLNIFLRNVGIDKETIYTDYLRMLTDFVLNSNEYDLTNDVKDKCGKLTVKNVKTTSQKDGLEYINTYFSFKQE